jgi:DNA-binding response OmpR family regulator
VAARLSIVVVEDHDDLREMTCRALRQLGHEVRGLGSAEELDGGAGTDPVDVFLIDLNLPGEDGLSLGRRLRRAYPEVGIVMVTARGALSDKLKGYESGADLYLPKPVPFPELCAAVGTFARKKQARQSAAEGLALYQLELTGPRGTVKLSDAEARLLTALARAPSGLLASWQLAAALPAPLDGMSKASLEVRIVRLRKKLLQAGVEGTVIESVRSVGYRLATPLRVL